MSLLGALNIGKSGLMTHQAAITVTSNNIANAGNPEFTRQVAHLVPGNDTRFKNGSVIGTGVKIDTIERAIDDALENRIRAGVSDNQAADTRQQWLSRVEAIFNEPGEADLSTQMSTFMGGWSNLANKPQDASLRQIVVQNGGSLAGSFRQVDSELSALQTDMDRRLQSIVREADALATRVAELNVEIAITEGSNGGATANSLRDQRDAVLQNLSKLVDIKTLDTGNGMVNVLIGSEPLVLQDQSRGLSFKTESVDGEVVVSVVNRKDGSLYPATGGQVGALVGLRAEVGEVAGEIDSLASNLIFELNKIHASGQGMEGFTTLTSASAVTDVAAALNVPASGLDHVPTTGSFVVHVKDKTTGLTTSTLIQVDLDGVAPDTSLNDLQASLDAVGGITATVASGRLKLTADAGNLEFRFSQDSSGTLAALGINTFFTGSSASDIAVNGVIKARPMLLAAAKNGEPTDNQTARAIAALEQQALAGLDGATLNTAYDTMINDVAVSAATARTNVEGSAAVLETLTTQRESLSGVSLDEEAINLIREQRAFQGAARVISVVDEMMKTLLNMV